MTTAIISNTVSEACRRALMLQGFNIIELPSDENLGIAVRSHPDTLLFRYKNEIITTAEYCETASYVFSDIFELSRDTRFIFTSEKRGAEYPADCIMNALVMGDKLFAREDSLSHAIKELCDRYSLTQVPTKQGYPACTVLKLSENAAITADAGMAKLLSSHGIRVTLIRAGHILLPPHEYGFIGGACARHGDKIYFFGSLESHPDKNIIGNAIKCEGLTAVSLSDEPLTDVGGCIFI